MSIDDMMKKAAHESLTIKIICADNSEYIGKSRRYTKADDEEGGFSSLSIDTGKNGCWCLFENEIKSIEEVAS